MRWLVLVACLSCCAAAATAGGARTAAADCPATLANELASTGTATQLVTVVAPQRTSTQGSLQLWGKSGSCWYPAAAAWTAWLGQRGVSEHRREGDRTTPAGAFGFLPTMYGVAANPGVRYRYHRVVCGDWWVEDARSPWYNRFKHVPCGSRPSFRVTSEDMSRSPTAYRHLAVIAYNRNPIVPGRGSGIFVHASTRRPTLGCVSLPLPQLLVTLRWLRPQSRPLIVIGTEARIRRF
jgi:L,D-peptidoglycan transpeptidase YkuD (ErfK/YbiS/YcfS/YnhG family)